MRDNRDPNSSRSFATGQYGNSVIQHYNPDEVEELSAAQIRQAHEAACAADQKLTTIQAGADEFILQHPEFLDTQHNANLIKSAASSIFGENTVFTAEHFAHAYNVLRSTGARLDIDQATVVKQQQAAENAKRKAINKAHADKAARTYNPENDYDNLSLEEIRQRAVEEAQQQMQIAGERGGNGF
jgi:hypothetical protein